MLFCFPFALWYGRTCSSLYLMIAKNILDMVMLNVEHMNRKLQ